MEHQLVQALELNEYRHPVVLNLTPISAYQSYLIPK